LILVMTMVVVCVTGVELYVLYRAAFEQQRERLIETAQGRARLLEAMLRHETEEVSELVEDAAHLDPLTATLNQVRAGHEKFRGFGETGEYTLARLEHDRIVFLLNHRHFDLENPQDVPLASDFAEPMRRALSGGSGTIVGLDYRGERVLAAHEPVEEWEFGIVAKIDMAEVRAPFIRAGLLAGSIALVFIFLGTLIFLRVGTPMVDRLEESERKYRGLFESAADMLFLAEFDGTILDANPAACESYAYSKQELIGKGITDLVSPDFRPLVASAVERLTIGESFHAESVDLRKDGTPFDVEVRMSPFLHEGREVIIAAVRDITKRKRVDEALRDRTRDLDERIKELNCLYGISRLAERPELSLSEMVQETVELIPSGWQHAEITCGRIRLNDLRFETPRFEETKWSQTTDITVDGDRVGTVEVFYLEETPEADEGPFLKEERDLIEAIAERLESHIKTKRTEEALQAERDNLVNIFDAMKDGVSVIDQNCDILYGNPALEADFGSWKGRRCFEYLEEREDACPWCDSDANFGGQTTRAECYSRKADKTYDLIATPLRLPDGKAARLEIRRDITERKQAERELQALNESLEQRVADRTAALEQRAVQLRRLTAELTQAEQRERRRLAQVLHDHLQQLLFGAKLQVGALKSESVDPDVLAPALAQLEDLLLQSINASRSLTVELYPPILRAEGLEQVLEWLASWMRDQHGLVVELSTEIEAIPLAEDVRVTIFHAVRELLFNVIKHAGVDRARVRVSGTAGDRLKIVVSDEGAGFEPSGEQITEDPSAGFGLFGIRERLESFGGELELDGAPGRGTRASLVVPISSIEQSEQSPELVVPDPRPQATSAAPVVPIRSPAKTGQKIRVLLVDDHEIAREGLTTLLQKESDVIVVGEASDGEMAVEMALRIRPDVIIMDVDMPRLSGIEATRRIVRELPAVRVIGLSMHSEPETATAMYESGADIYLDKAGPFETLLSVLRNSAPV
jgi:PAS domain S-box-containing protein